MSATEIMVVVTAAFIGYWIVSAIMERNAKNNRPAESDEEPHDDHYFGTRETGRAAPAAWPQILDVPSDASLEHVRSAYSSLIAQYHPDKVSALGPELKALAEQKTLEINAAYAEALEHFNAGA